MAKHATLEELVSRGRRLCWTFDVRWDRETVWVACLIGPPDAHKPFEQSVRLRRGQDAQRAAWSLAQHALRQLPGLIRTHGGPPRDRVPA